MGAMIVISLIVVALLLGTMLYDYGRMIWSAIKRIFNY